MIRNAYNRIAPVYEYDMAMNMRLDDVSYYVARAAEREGPVLELGCGTGRITSRLLEAGLRVVGADVSEGMLAQLRPRRSEGGLLLVQMDLSQWALRAKFATILCPYSLITYFPDEEALQRLLAGAAGCLAPAGAFIVDAFIPDRGLPYGEWKQDYCRVLPGDRVLRRAKRVERESGAVNVIERRYRLEDPRGERLDEFSVTDRIREFQPGELSTILERNGFQIVGTDWDYGARPAREGASFVAFRCALSCYISL